MDSAAPHRDDALPTTPRARRAKAAAAPAKPLNLQPLPRWVGQGCLRDGERAVAEPDAATLLAPEARAGAALFALDQMLRADPPWLGALRMRLTLQAAVATARLLRLSADDATLRDVEQLTRPGDDPGPAGRVHRLWRLFAGRPTRLAEEAAEALAAETGGKGGAGEGHGEVIGLMQADAGLATTLGWERPVPLAAVVIGDPLWREGKERRPFRVGGEGWEARRMAVFGLAAWRAHALAVDLARRAETLTEAADRLRTRDGGAGVRLILADDCVAPWRMAGNARTHDEAGGPGLGQKGLGSDRAARRFCESLHAMGALRLLTDRPTFRLYGL